MRVLSNNNALFLKQKCKINQIFLTAISIILFFWPRVYWSGPKSIKVCPGYYGLFKFFELNSISFASNYVLYSRLKTTFGACFSCFFCIWVLPLNRDSVEWDRFTCFCQKGPVDVWAPERRTQILNKHVFFQFCQNILTLDVTQWFWGLIDQCVS